MKIDDMELMEKMKKSTIAELNRDKLVKEAKRNGVFLWDYRKVGGAMIDGSWEQEKFRTLYTLFLKATQETGVDELDRKRNFVLASPGIVAALESLDQFEVDFKAKMTKSIHKVGTVGRYTVYRDMQAITDYAVVGISSTAGHVVNQSCRYVEIRGMADSSLSGKLY